MKRKVALALVLILAIGGGLMAEGSPLTPYVDKGSLLANVGIGWGGLSGGAEMTFARIDIGGIIPITFGAAARAFVDPGIFYSWSSFSFGAGGFGTAHVGFKELTLPSGLSWFSDCDVYVGLGLGFASATGIGSDVFKPGIGISTFEGVSYYLNDTLAINFEYGYIGRVTYDWGFGSIGGYPLYYSTVGVILKL